MGKITILRQKIIFFPIAEGGAKIFGVFRVKNHDFTPKKNHIFFQFRGGGARRVRPLDPPLYIICKRARLLQQFSYIMMVRCIDGGHLLYIICKRVRLLQ